MDDFFNMTMGTPENADNNLNDSLIRIQEKYSEWFERHIGQDDDPEKRTILYYKVVYINPPEILFNIKIDGMPEQIWHECFEAFKVAYEIED